MKNSTSSATLDQVEPRVKLSLKDLVLVSLFCALIAIGAFIRVPVPVVPFTLQLLFTMLAGLLLGPRLGALSVMLYLALGLIGLPIFTEGGGLWYFLKPTFGYLIGFAVGSYVTGRLTQRPDISLRHILVANFAGLFVVYLFGLVYLYVIMNAVLGTPIGLWSVFLYGFVLAVPGDIALCFLAALLALRLIPILRSR